jgi:hypothetical protein
LKKVVVLFAACVFAATVIIAAVHIRRYRDAQQVPPDAEKIARTDPRVVYDVSPGPKSRAFDLACDVTLKKPESAARVVFDFTDAKNHHYVEFTPHSASIVVMQDGIGRVIESVDHLVFPVATPMHVSIQRRELAIRVIVDDVLAVSAFDETFHLGQVGYASLEGAADVSKPRLQAIGDIYFADDFMRDDKEKGPWTELCGNWHVNALEHASMSANAFQYNVTIDKDAEGTAVAGYPFWNDYSFQAAVKPQKKGAVGLYFYYRDENNFFRFDWYPQEDNAPGSGRKELVKMWHGDKQVLARVPGGFQINQWYTLKCEVSGQRLRTFIDQNLVFDTHDGQLVSGMVGLYAGPNSRASFDDVYVRSYKYFEDTFTNGSRTAWSFVGGDWSRVNTSVTPTRAEDHARPGAAVSSGVLTVHSPKGEARAAVGDSSWKNYVLETEIYPDAEGRTGVLLYYQDETRYYQVVCRRAPSGPETWTLERVLDDQRSVLDSASVDASGRKLVSAGVRDGYLWVAVNGRRILEGFDTSLASGRAGLFAADLPVASFGPVRVDWPLQPAPLLTLNEVFEHEDSMSEWSAESDWRRAESGLWLHKGNFPGDAMIETDVRGIDPGAAELELVLSADTDSPASGYALKLTSGLLPADAPVKVVTASSLKPDAPAKTSVAQGSPAKPAGQPLAAAAPAKSDAPARSLELFRKGESIGVLPIDSGVLVSRLALKRTGSYLFGFVNRKVVLAVHDADPLKGDTLGWYANNVRVDPKTVAVSSPSVHEYLFRKANTDWRVVAGIWDVTNRWQCDPRWTFFSGRSSLNLAAIWNKLKLPGDVTLDFYVGPKMDSARGKNYEYASDMNCTLSGDGSDLSSGYSFLFGGFGNTKTVLLRENKIVAEGNWKGAGSQGYQQAGQPALIPSARMSIHHTWFHLKAQRKGNRLRLWIEDQLIIDYTDDKPLTGDRVALWTWNNGIMMARVIVTNEKAHEFESPDAFHPVHCRCVYDEPLVAGGATVGTAVPSRPGSAKQ